MKRIGSGAVLVVVALAGDPEVVVAQQGRVDPLSSLSSWADDMWLTILDRDGAYWGRVATQGVFQRFNLLMHTDYELNVRLARFSPAEEARWADVSRGLRGSGASLSHPHLLNLVEWRERVPIGGPVDLVVRYVRERSFTAQRDYVRMGVRWREAFGTGWDAGLEFGVHFFKPSADVELIAVRRWGDDERAWAVEVRAAVLDAFSNVVFNELGVRPEEQDLLIDYDSQPLAAKVSVRRIAPLWRVEAHGGTTTRTRAAISYAATDGVPFALLEDVAFAGALGELHATRALTVAAYGTLARASTERESADPSVALRVSETTRVGGVRARHLFRGALAGELDAQATWRPEARQGAAVPAIDHTDRELMAIAGVARAPAAGWNWRLALSWSDREAGALAPGLTKKHRRQLMEGGYRFTSGFDVNAGVRWNLDDLSTVLFAGGHVRFTTSW